MPGSEERHKMTKWDPVDDFHHFGEASRSSLEAAAEAAAKVNAMLIAKGKLKPSQLSNVTASQTKQKATQAQTSMEMAEVEINDVPISCRNLLTRGSTQDEISKMSGAAVSTRGRFMSPDDRVHSGPGDRPLYLCVQGPSKDCVEKAVVRIREIIGNSYRNKTPKIPGPRLPGVPPPMGFRPRLPVVEGPGIIPTPPPLMSLATQPPGIPLLQDKLFIGLEHAPPTFDVKNKILGPMGTYLQHIQAESSAKVTLHGKGSGFIEPTTGREAFEPMHLLIQHPTAIGVQHAKQLAENLVQTVQQDYAQFQQALVNMSPNFPPGQPAPIMASVPPQPGLPPSGPTWTLAQPPPALPGVSVATPLPGPVQTLGPPPSHVTVSVSQPGGEVINGTFVKSLPQYTGSVPQTVLINTSVPPPNFVSMPQTSGATVTLTQSQPPGPLVHQLCQAPPPLGQLPPPGAPGGPITSLPPLSGPITSLPPFSGPITSMPPPGGPITSFPPLSGPITSLPPLGGPITSLPPPSGPITSLPPCSGPITSMPPPPAGQQTNIIQLQPAQQMVSGGVMTQTILTQQAPPQGPPPMEGLVQHLQPLAGPQVVTMPPPHTYHQAQPPPNLSQPPPPILSQPPPNQPMLSQPPPNQPILSQPLPNPAILSQPPPSILSQPDLSQPPPNMAPVISQHHVVTTTTSAGHTYYNQYIPAEEGRPAQATQPPARAAQHPPSRPHKDDRKRRFTEEKDENLPTNILGYQHGPSHLATVVTSKSLSEPVTSQPYGTVAQHPGLPERVEGDRVLMPPPPAGSVMAPHDKQKLMPPPPLPPFSLLASEGPLPKKAKGALGNVSAKDVDTKVEPFPAAAHSLVADTNIAHSFPSPAMDNRPSFSANNASVEAQDTPKSVPINSLPATSRVETMWTSQYNPATSSAAPSVLAAPSMSVGTSAQQYTSSPQQTSIHYAGPPPPPPPPPPGPYGDHGGYPDHPRPPYNGPQPPVYMTGMAADEQRRRVSYWT